MSQQTYHDWLSERPFTLALSAGFFGLVLSCGDVWNEAPLPIVD